MLLKYTEPDYVWNENGEYSYEDVEYVYQATDKEVEFLKTIDVPYMYNHMKESIGKMTPTGMSKLIPPISFGCIEISLQINYQLWSMRVDNHRDHDNSPITKEEFDLLVDVAGEKHIDVRVRYNGLPLIKATQMSLWQLENVLYSLPVEE